jgi:hypothetical protein
MLMNLQVHTKSDGDQLFCAGLFGLEIELAKVVPVVSKKHLFRKKYPCRRP